MRLHVVTQVRLYCTYGCLVQNISAFGEFAAAQVVVVRCEQPYCPMRQASNCPAPSCGLKAPAVVTRVHQMAGIVLPSRSHYLNARTQDGLLLQLYEFLRLQHRAGYRGARRAISLVLGREPLNGLEKFRRRRRLRTSWIGECGGICEWQVAVIAISVS